MVSGAPQLPAHNVTNSLTPRNQDAYCCCHTSQQMSVDSRATGVSSSVAQGIADMAQSWAHLARDIAPQVPELPAVIQQEVAALVGTSITEDSVNQVARLITRRVEEAGHPDLAAALLRRMGRAMYELLLLLATEEELRAMGMLMQATKAPGPPGAPPASPPAAAATSAAGPLPDRPFPAAPRPQSPPSAASSPQPAGRQIPVAAGPAHDQPSPAAPGPEPPPSAAFSPQPAGRQIPVAAKPAAPAPQRPQTPAAEGRPRTPGAESRAPAAPSPGAASNWAAPVQIPPAPPPAGSGSRAEPQRPAAAASSPSTLPESPGKPAPIAGRAAPAGGQPSAAPAGQLAPSAVPIPRANPPMAPLAGDPGEEAVLWGFDPAARETEKAVPAPRSQEAPPAQAATEPALAVEAKAAEPPQSPSLARAVGSEPIGSGARRWSVRLSPKAQAERDSRLQKRLGELPPLLEEIAAQVHEQRREVAEKGQARAAVRSSSEQSAPADLATASNLMTDLLGAGRLADAAALAMRAAEAFPGQAAAELACRAGGACREGKDEELAVLCFTTAVLAAPPCEDACWQLAGMALEQREPRLAPIWMEFLARLLRVRGADEDAVVVYRQLLNLTPRRQDVRDILRVASLTGTLPD